MSGGELVGTWRLSSWEIRTACGEVYNPCRLDPKGLLVYTNDAYMSGAIMRANRRRVDIPVRELMNLRRALMSNW